MEHGDSGPAQPMYACLICLFLLTVYVRSQGQPACKRPQCSTLHQRIHRLALSLIIFFFLFPFQDPSAMAAAYGTAATYMATPTPVSSITPTTAPAQVCMDTGGFLGVLFLLLSDVRPPDFMFLSFSIFPAMASWVSYVVSPFIPSSKGLMCNVVRPPANAPFGERLLVTYAHVHVSDFCDFFFSHLDVCVRIFAPWFAATAHLQYTSPSCHAEQRHRAHAYHQTRAGPKGAPGRRGG